jgi:hypothetical protein
MILRTKIAWLKAKEETEEEKLKKEVLGDEYQEDTSKESFDKTKKDAIIDTDNDKIYIQLYEDQVCIQKLLQTEFLPTEDGTLTRYEDSIIIYSTLDEIYEQLTKPTFKNL